MQRYAEAPFSQISLNWAWNKAILGWCISDCHPPSISRGAKWSWKTKQEIFSNPKKERLMTVMKDTYRKRKFKLHWMGLLKNLNLSGNLAPLYKGAGVKVPACEDWNSCPFQELLQWTPHTWYVMYFQSIIKKIQMKMFSATTATTNFLKPKQQRGSKN